MAHRGRSLTLFPLAQILPSHQCLTRPCLAFPLSMSCHSSTPRPCCCRPLWCLATSTDPGTFALPVASTSPLRFVPCPPLWSWSRMVESGSCTPERWSSLHCTRTSKTLLFAMFSLAWYHLDTRATSLCLCLSVSICMCKLGFNVQAQ